MITKNPFQPIINQVQAHEAWLWAHAWFTEIVFRKVYVCVYVYVYVCMYVCMFVFPHPREQSFIAKSREMKAI